ncbi:hypothetical protein GCM10010317_001480 [Streptomyces mirabilis]|uniref:hypothetical protein n=1 Tax=Streptomyces mirabilis TaxID=68239 RepID=UPI0019A0A28C|nr:hypothetical protein [Streptomyces mirabilis]GHD36778.1 hypothetical protein GCM10010317_001480 [Streptomyces mirabilis]
MGDRPGLAQALKPANSFLAATTLAATSAGTFITVLVLWDLLGHLPLPLGVAGHEGSTVLVGLNGCGCCGSPHGVGRTEADLGRCEVDVGFSPAPASRVPDA